MRVMELPVHPSGETMEAVCFTSFGETTDALSIQTIPKPFITKPNQQVLIQVHACAVNPIDKERLSGDLQILKRELYARNVLGYDVSGIIVEMGADIKDTDTEFKVNDEVYVCLNECQFGALSNYVVCHMAELGTKPKNLSFVEAASIPLAGLTALQSLRKGGVTEGSKVFIPGGAGGVGSLAIQIAKKVLKASHVTTTASPGIGTELCTDAGADRVIDYRSEDFESLLKGEDFDMAFDTMNQGGKFGGLLKKGGAIVSISGLVSFEAMEEASERFDKFTFVDKMFCWLFRNRKAEHAAKSNGGTWDYNFMKPIGADLNELAPYFERGELKAIIDTEAPSLSEFKIAVDKLWSGRAKGKCVIKVV